MGRRRPSDRTAPFQSINETSRLTGVARDAIRRGVKAGMIPAIRIGSGNNAPYLVDVERYLEQLHRAAEEGVSL